MTTDLPPMRARSSSLAESPVTTFLKGALADAPVDVAMLEVMARSAELLGERQRISTAKPFRKAKSALGIQSIRDGFGPGGAWLWKLPRDREAPAASSIKRQPVRTERRVPLDWIEGVERLQYHRPMTGVPQHRWRQFIDDCNNFLSSKQAERAAELGWNARLLFGSRRDRPLMHPGGAGLLWAINGGRLVELHRDWVVIELPANGSRRVFERRRVDAGNVTLPWIEWGRRPGDV